MYLQVHIGHNDLGLSFPTSFLNKSLSEHSTNSI